MRVWAAWVVAFATVVVPQMRAQDGPYKVLKRARVGGEGGWDYIYADSAGRRLYIPRSAVRVPGATPGQTAQPQTQTAGQAGGSGPRLTVFDLDTLAPVGEIAGVGGQGTAVDPKNGH